MPTPRSYLRALVVVSLGWSLSDAAGGGPRVIVVTPAIAQRAPAPPFKVAATRPDGEDVGFRKVVILGSRAKGTTIAAWLNVLPESGRPVSARLFLEEAAATDGGVLVDWQIEIGAWREHVGDTYVEIFVQPEGVAYGAGQTYRVPLADWIGTDEQKP